MIGVDLLIILVCVFTGPVCAVCDDGYAYHTITQKCEVCSHTSFIGATAVLILLAIIIGVALLAFIGRNHKIKNLTELYLLVFTKMGMLNSNDIDLEQRARFMVIRCKSALKIYVTLWQVVSIMPFALDLRFPDAYTVLVTALNSVNIDVSRSSLVSCSSGRSYDAIDSLIVDTAGPIVLVILLWSAYIVHMKLTAPHSESANETMKANYHKVFLVFTYLILPSTSAKIFQVFSCRDVDPDDIVADSDDMYMAVDYSVSCSSS